VRKNWILAASIQETSVLIEPFRLTSENGREVEAEAVHSHFLRPVAEAIGHKLEDATVAEIDRVSRAGVIIAAASRAACMEVLDVLDRAWSNAAPVAPKIASKQIANSGRTLPRLSVRSLRFIRCSRTIAR
jgi:hypothetical protein